LSSHKLLHTVLQSLIGACDQRQASDNLGREAEIMCAALTSRLQVSSVKQHLNSSSLLYMQLILQKKVLSQKP
jgi:hypothetical protein